MDLAEWDERYRSDLKARAARDSDACPLLVKTAANIAPGRALDLACGSGRNALWLAQHGWRVTAVDGSAAAIEALAAGAERLSVAVDAHLADLEKAEFTIAPSRWELIAMCRYLQRDLFAPAKLGLVPGGVMVATALMVEPGREDSPYRLQPGELRGYFEGWEILHDREGAGEPGHTLAEIVARRPR